MPKSKFTYETYIATTAETLWKALLDGEFARQYRGAEPAHRGRAAEQPAVILGEVVAASAPNYLVIAWANPQDRGQKDGHSRVTFDIETIGDMVRLTVTHDNLEPASEVERETRLGGEEWGWLVLASREPCFWGDCLEDWGAGPGVDSRQV